MAKGKGTDKPQNKSGFDFLIEHEKAKSDKEAANALAEIEKDKKLSFRRNVAIVCVGVLMISVLVYVLVDKN
jgi:hypothetical protein